MMTNREIDACVKAILDRNKDDPAKAVAEFKEFNRALNRAMRAEYKALFGIDIEDEPPTLFDRLILPDDIGDITRRSQDFFADVIRISREQHEDGGPHPAGVAFDLWQLLTRYLAQYELPADRLCEHVNHLVANVREMIAEGTWNYATAPDAAPKKGETP
jgi:hypothetical protein